MKAFAQLIKQLDSTNKTTAKIKALSDYFSSASEDDKLWTIAILSHKRPPRAVNTTILKEYAAELANIPFWLFDESYHIVGDLAETIALVTPSNPKESTKSLSTFLQEIIELKAKSDDEKKTYVLNNWNNLGYYEKFVFTKLFTGGFRIGVSQKIMTKALALSTGIDEDILAYRLMGKWTPQTTSFQKLIIEENKSDEYSKPYPFYLAYALEEDFTKLGNVKDWAIEHKWDGIRGQLIIRSNEAFVWTRGEELVTDKYPEYGELVSKVENGTVLDGEILVRNPDGSIGSFNQLQTRIGRKTVSKKQLAEAPVMFKAYDILEYKNKDIRTEAYSVRRTHLEEIVQQANSNTLQLSAYKTYNSWEEVKEERKNARALNSEGLMLKQLNSPYRIGRKKGDWWKWKTDPLTIDGVLTYAMRGHGRRSNLFTDYTFGVWTSEDVDNRELVTFAKAYSGLTDAEFKEVDKFIKNNTLERFGPVRSVTPKLVFEIAFEGITLSKRHKSGIALRFPRILRWRKDKPMEEANTVDDLKALIT